MFLIDEANVFHQVIYPSGTHLHIWHHLPISGQFIGQSFFPISTVKLRPLHWCGRAIQIIIYQNMAHETLIVRHLLKLFSFVHMFCLSSTYFSLTYYSVTAVCQITHTQLQLICVSCVCEVTSK